MDRLSVQRTLDWLKEIKGGNPFYDLHVHPVEVMFAPFEHYPSPGTSGLFSTGSANYSPPAVADLDLRKGEASQKNVFDKKLLEKLVVLHSRRIYAHTGPKVLSDNMGLGAIDQALLLPVVRDGEVCDEQLRSMKEMFGSDERFLFGYCLSNDIPDDEVTENVKRAKDEYGIKALKIHPSVTGIDISRPKGVRRIESILEASQRNKLKVIIHGGRSPDCENRQASAYGTLNNLQRIDWSITSEAVIIAHSGCFGHSAAEAAEEVLPQMGRLLDTYPHLSVDTSGTEFDVLCQVLKNIDPQRIVFGSDLLYESQWSAMVKLWWALEQTVIRPEDTLLRICSFNPASLFNVSNVDTQQREVPVDSVCRSAG